jgi:MFS family permease
MPKRYTIFILFTAAYFLSEFFRSTNAVIAPDLSAEMGLNAAQLGLMTSLFFATFAAMQLPVGVWLDRVGARRVTPLLMLVAVAGSILFATASGFGLLAAGRALIGVGMAGVLMGGLKILSRWFPPERFATLSGLLVGIGSLGSLVAATPLAQLNQILGWRSVFWIGGGITAVTAVILFTWGNDALSESSQIAQKETAGGLQDVLGNGRLWRLVPLNFFITGTILSYQGLWAGPYLYDVLMFNEMQVGTGLIWLSIGSSAGYLVSGWLADRFGVSRTLIMTAILFSVSQLGLALRLPQAVIMLLYGLFGFTGSFNMLLLATSRHLFPLHLTGKAVTAVNLFGIGGTFVLQWLSGVIVGQFPRNAAGQYPPQAYTAALLVTALGGLLALLWYLPLTRRTAPQIAVLPKAD